MAVVLFGSQTGNAEEIAKLIHSDIKKTIKTCRIYSFQHYIKENKSIDALERERLICVVCSTTGEGDPPDNAKAARRAIISKGDTFLKNSYYTVLGLGDSNYSNFNAMGKFWDTKLAKCGAKCFHPKGLADDGTSLDLVVEPWRKGLTAAIRKLTTELPELIGGGTGSGAAATNGCAATATVTIGASPAVAVTIPNGDKPAEDKKVSPNQTKEPDTKPVASITAVVTPIITPVATAAPATVTIPAPSSVVIGNASSNHLDSQKTSESDEPPIGTPSLLSSGSSSFVSIPLDQKQDLLSQMIARKAAAASAIAAGGEEPTVLDHMREMLEDQKVQEMLASELAKKSHRSWFRTPLRTPNDNGTAVPTGGGGGAAPGNMILNGGRDPNRNRERADRLRASMDDKRENENNLKPMSRVSSTASLTGLQQDKPMSRNSSTVALDKLVPPASPNRQPLHSPSAAVAANPAVAVPTTAAHKAPERPRSPQLIQKQDDPTCGKTDKSDHKDASAHVNSKTQEQPTIATAVSGESKPISERKTLRANKPPKERDPNKPQRPSSQSAADKERGVPRLRESSIRVLFDDHKTSEPAVRKQRDDYFVARWKNIDTESALKGYSAESPFFGRITAARWLSTARSHRPARGNPHSTNTNPPHHYPISTPTQNNAAHSAATASVVVAPTPNVNLVNNGSGVTSMITASPSIVAAKPSAGEARSNIGSGHSSVQRHNNNESSTNVIASTAALIAGTTPSAEPTPRPATAIAQAAAQTAQPPDGKGVEQQTAPPPPPESIDAQHTPRRILHLEIELPSGHDGVMYEPGDAVGVYCPNDERVVDAMLRRLGFDGERVISGFQPIGSDSKTCHLSHIHWPCTVRDVFLYCVDITSPPRKQFLRLLAEYCSDEAEREILKLWSSRAGAAEYDRLVTAPHTGLWELLCDFPSCKPPLDHLIDQLPNLSARSYSVTSSSLLHPSHVHLAFTIVEYAVTHNDWRTKQPITRTKRGVASHFLYRLAVASGLLPAEAALDTCPALDWAPGVGSGLNSGGGSAGSLLLTAGGADTKSSPVVITATPIVTAASPSLTDTANGGSGAVSPRPPRNDKSPDPHDWWSAAAAMTAREQAGKAVAGLGPLPGSFRTSDGRAVTVPIFIKRSQHFGVPDDLNDPIIMIGPGTGVCPFRGFLQHRHCQRHAREQGCGAGVCEGYWRGLQLANEGIEEGDEGEDDIESARCCGSSPSPAPHPHLLNRAGSGAGGTPSIVIGHAHGPSPPATVTGATALAVPAGGVAALIAHHIKRDSGSLSVQPAPPPPPIGEALLFFGCRRAEEDFLYRDDFHQFVSNQTLTALHTAFSREREQKLYVQHRLIENGKQIAALILEKKAQVFVCGDGNRMARDVQTAIVQVLTAHGGLTAEKAKAYVAEMLSTQRYVQDIWS